MPFLSKRAKVVSTKPAYKKKIKTDNGYKWVYSPRSISKRVEEKHKKLELVKKIIGKLRAQYEKDMGAEDLRTRALACIVALVDETAIRVGNEDSAKEAKTYGATTLKVNHISFSGNKAKLHFPGKRNVEQNLVVTNSKAIKVLKELIKGKSPSNFVFEIEGAKIWDRGVNRYLQPFEISVKDLRMFRANKEMKDELKHSDWEEALENVADQIGHTKNVLKNEYLDPAFVEKHETKKAGNLILSKRAGITEDIYDAGNRGMEWLKSKLTPNTYTPTTPPTPTALPTAHNIAPNVQTNTDILNAWNTLQPFLPQTAQMTSGIRTTEHQTQLIQQAWSNHQAQERYPQITDPAQQARILTSEFNYLIAGPTSSPHIKGTAFDIGGSGQDLNEIASIVSWVSNQHQLGVTLRPQIEHGNNAVHVNIGSASYHPEEVAKLINSLEGSQVAADDGETDEVKEVLDAFLDSNPSDEVRDEILEAFGQQHHKTAAEQDFPKTCSCGRVYETVEEFMRQPLCKSGKGRECWGDFDLVCRDCSCDSTLSIKAPCVHKADDAKDEESKYEAEKGDEKWQEVLIDRDGTTLTRKQIRDHYLKHSAQILKEIKNKPVMLYIATGKNEHILKRKHNDQPIIIKAAADLEYWSDRRLLSIHYVMGPKTKLGWVDLDLHDFPMSRAKDYAHKVVAAIKSELGVSAGVWESGGTGLHIQFELKQEIDIDELRDKLKGMLDELNKDYDDVSVGLIKGCGMRSDISTLHNLGNLRVPYALGETWGREKKPLNTKLASMNRIASIALRDKLWKAYGEMYALNQIEGQEKLTPVLMRMRDRVEGKLQVLLPEIIDLLRDHLYGGWLKHTGTESFVKYYKEMLKEDGEKDPDEWERNFRETYAKVAKIRDSLKPTSDAHQNMALLHIALTTAHQSGAMSLYLGHFFDVDSAYLDALTRGDWANQWDVLRFLGSKTASISKRAGVYGYWLSPEGKAYEVKFEQHKDFIAANPEFFGEISGYVSCSIAFERGWTRVIMSGDYICFEVPDSSDKYIKLVQDALPSLPQKRAVMYELWKASPELKYSVGLSKSEFMTARTCGDLAKLERDQRLSGCFASLSKRARDFDWGVSNPLTSQELTRLYELEYKLGQLRQSDSLRPSTLKRIDLWELELKQLLHKALNTMKQIFGEWIDLHNMNPIEVFESSYKDWPGDPKHFIRDYDAWVAGERTKYDDYFRAKEQESKRKQLTTEPFVSIIRIYKKLGKGGDMGLFQEALNTAHYGGLMVNHLAEQAGITKQLLDDLSAGKFIDKWDQELRTKQAATLDEQNEDILKQLQEQEQEQTKIENENLSRQELTNRFRQDLETNKKHKQEEREKMWRGLNPEEDISKETPEQAEEKANSNPADFLEQPQWHQKFPQFVDFAVSRLARRDSSSYFMLNYYKDKRYAKYNKEAILALIATAPWIYFTKMLHKDPEFSLYQVAAAHATAQKDPKFFLDTLLPIMPRLDIFKGLAEKALSKKASMSKRATETPYGWWLSPHGKIYEVGFQGHIAFVKRHPELFGALENRDALDVAFDLGWVKASLAGYLDFVVPESTNHYYQLIQSALSKGLPETEMPYVVITDSRNGKSIKMDRTTAQQAPTLEVARKHRTEDDKEITASISKRAASTNITWIKPDFKSEVGEYFENEATKGWMRAHGLAFDSNEDLIAFLSNGSLKEISKKDLTGAHNITLGGSDFEGELKDPEYAQSFNEMENELGKYDLALPAPIILNVDGAYYGFSGNRRMNLTFKHDLPFQVWVVSRKISKRAKDDLVEYKAKRQKDTPEPEGKAEVGKNKHHFVIQEHDASHLHWDLRLENDSGSLTSFALPKHHLPDKGERLLAKQTEDHPIEYVSFGSKSGGETIPSGSYGAGKVRVVSKSKTYKPIEWTKSTIKFEIPEGRFTLHRTDGKNWMIMRSKEE
jgi:DNA ligase D-like protein (predicted 3'-phosphoesterase)